MTEFSIAHEFDTDTATFWSVFLNGQFLDEWYRAGGLARTELGREDSADKLVVTARFVAERQPPAIIRSVLGNKQFGYIETATFIKNASRLEQSLQALVMAERIRFSGVITAEPIGARRVRQLYTGSVNIDMPLVGKKIERSTVEEMERTHAEAANVTRAWLARAA
jgi:hypothetical protein